MEDSVLLSSRIRRLCYDTLTDRWLVQTFSFGFHQLLYIRVFFITAAHSYTHDLHVHNSDFNVAYLSYVCSLRDCHYHPCFSSVNRYLMDAKNVSILFERQHPRIVCRYRQQSSGNKCRQQRNAIIAITRLTASFTHRICKVDHTHLWTTYYRDSK